MRVKVISLLIAIVVFLSSCKVWTSAQNGFGLFQNRDSTSFNRIMKSKDYDFQLRMANRYYDKKDYNHAQQLYEQLFPILKGGPQFEDIYYKFAFSYFNLKDYANAEHLFKGFVEVFPNSVRAEEMDYMRAYTYYKQSPKADLDQTNTTKTIGFMQAFINTHPGSARNKDATDIIDKCRVKLEMKDFKNAQLYYDLQQYKAAGIVFNSLLNTYPDSERGDQYKLFVIKSDYQYATLSVEEKRPERYQQVITDCNDFIDRFPDSKLSKEVKDYLNLCQNNIKPPKNEQVKKTS